MTNQKPKLTWIGVGAMGSRMSPHLANTVQLQIFDADPKTAEAVAAKAGADVITRIQDVADSDFVVLMLPDSTIIDRVVSGTGANDGLLDHMRTGAMIVDMSSSQPGSTVKNHAAATERRIKFVDAPVSGGIGGAERATLAIMAGGTADDVEQAKPILDQLGSNVRHVGDIGAGHAVKALNNVLAATSFMATAEVLTTGKMFGLDPEVMVDVMQKSSGSNFPLMEVYPQAVLTGTYDAGFALKLMEKDVRVAMSLFAETSAPSRLMSVVADVYREGLAQADEGADYSVLAKQNDELAGLGG